MLFKDHQAIKARGFKDPESYVRIDNSEKLFGEDWDDRKRELWQRCGGRCEEIVGERGASYIRCSRPAHDAHHVRKRSDFRDDRLSNLQALCRQHHQQHHPEKQVQWTKRDKQIESVK